MIIEHHVSVDFTNRDSIQVVNFVQHDQNIPVLFVDLYSGGSKLEIDFSKTIAKIYLRVSLPNGAFADIESTETSGDGPKSGKISTVTFGLGYNVFPAYGAANAIVLITEKATGSTEYTNRAGSSPIVFMIDKDPIQDGSEESLDQYYGLRGYIEDVSENVVKENALSIPKDGEIIPPKTAVYAPAIIINRTGKVTRKEWFPTDLPNGNPNKVSTSGGSFVRRDESKNILVPWKHKNAGGSEITEYAPAISGEETDSKIDSKISSEKASILNPLLEGLANPYIFALQANVHSFLAYSRMYINKNNGEQIEYSVGNDPCVFAGVTSVRFKNDGDAPISITFVMNGTQTTINLQAHGSSSYEETVTLNGNMTVVGVRL